MGYGPPTVVGELLCEFKQLQLRRQFLQVLGRQDVDLSTCVYFEVDVDLSTYRNLSINFIFVGVIVDGIAS